MKSEHKVYGERKVGISLYLTPTLIREIETFASESGCSKSEAVERAMRQKLGLRGLD